MSPSTLPRLRPWTALFALAVLIIAPAATGRAEARRPLKQVTTRTPIKHVIVVIGENRTFDHIFGLYRPRAGQTVSNLLSKGIVKADGTPGPHFARAAQSQVAPQPSYYISVPNKTPYAVLPPPNIGDAPNERSDGRPPFKTIAEAAAFEPALEPKHA